MSQMHENHIYESSLRKFHRQKTEHVWNSNVNRVTARGASARVSYCHKFPPRKAANRIWIGVLSHDKFHDKFEAVNQLSWQRRSIRPRTNRSGIILENVVGCKSSGKSLEKVDPWNMGILGQPCAIFEGNSWSIEQKYQCYTYVYMYTQVYTELENNGEYWRHKNEDDQEK